jgi:hypothetical protein
MTQADSPNTTNLSRRRLLAGVPAVAAVGVPSVATALGGLATGDDAKLLALVDKYFADDAEYDRLSAAETELSTKHYASVPTPDVLRVRPEDEALGIQTSASLHYAHEEMLREGGLTVPKTEQIKPSHYDHMSVADLRKPKWLTITKLDFPPDVGPWYAGGFVGTRYVEPSPAARARADEIIAAYDEWNKAREMPESVALANDDLEAAVEELNELRNEIEDTPALTFAGLVAKARVAIKREEEGEEAWSFAKEIVNIAALQAAA